MEPDGQVMRVKGKGRKTTTPALGRSENTKSDGDKTEEIGSGDGDTDSE